MTRYSSYLHSHGPLISQSLAHCRFLVSGTTVDVILVNGRLRNGEIVVMPGTEGPIVTHIRELLMPEPMRELRVKVRQ